MDSFRTFALLDYKDLSANYGKINDINTKVMTKPLYARFSF